MSVGTVRPSMETVLISVFGLFFFFSVMSSHVGF